MEGESVTLFSSVTEVQRTDDIRWTFGADGALIALVDNNQITLYNGSDGRFRRRLQLDHQTASLTINNITKTHAGLYQLTINKGQNIPDKKFNLIVYPGLPVPVIRKSQCVLSSSSSVQYCLLMCSVVNVSAVSLSWYKGNSVLSSISTSDLSISLSLPLEVEYQDNNTYSCVLNDPISHQIIQLDTSQLCQRSSDCQCCGSTEGVIKLVISALVGLAAAAFVLYDIRSRNAEQERSEKK
nr:SLAM family member 5-like [Danio rerio]|eukprot:XP_002666221.3 SLAM family member 5-like [Danio rerio]